jgi:tRNA(Ile)-lysidine synthase
MSKPGIVDNEYFYANFENDSSNRNVYLKDYPITIRTYRNGDKYQIKNYEVLVRRLFIDWKMPKHLRKVWPIIENKDGRIIYIPRYRKEFKPDSNCNFYVKECFTLK